MKCLFTLTSFCSAATCAGGNWLFLKTFTVLTRSKSYFGKKNMASASNRAWNGCEEITQANYRSSAIQSPLGEFAHLGLKSQQPAYDGSDLKV